MNRIVKQIFFLLFLSVLTFAQEPQQRPKNIILMIGDGMGLNYVATNVIRNENSPFKRFNTIGLSITASVDSLITDSAAGATAMATGYRTKNTYIAEDTTSLPLYTFFEHANLLGLSTGVVVTDEISGATPSAFLVHEQSRYRREEITNDLLNCEVNVVIGGGRKYFVPESEGGTRTDGKNLIKDMELKGYKFYYDYDDLPGENATGKFYALLSDTGLPKAPERDYTLGDLTGAALNNLSKNEKGFVLMVEGSQIDWASHDTDVVYLVPEINDFATAVKTALDFAEEDGNTLVIVTADHETGGLTITEGNADGTGLRLQYLTNHHTGGFVGVYAKGPGEELFRGIYGNYMIGRKIFKLLDPSFTFTLKNVK